MKTYEGQFGNKDLKFAIVISRFNEKITNELLSGALHTLKQHGIKEEHISVTWVPGAFEIPIAASTLAEKKTIDAVICLGCVIRGSTPHFDYVAGQASGGIMQASLKTGVPMVFGVLTTDTIDQAIERAGTKCGNKGREAALSALEMADLIQRIPR